MPFPIIEGLPIYTTEEQMSTMRRRIVAAVVQEMKCPKSWVHPLLHKDELPKPEDDTEGSDTIFIRLDSAMFHDMLVKLHIGKNEVDATVLEDMIHTVLNAIAQVVFNTYNETIEVEAFLGDLVTTGKVLLAPKK